MAGRTVLAHQYIGAKSAFQLGQARRAPVSSFAGDEFRLKLLMVALFLPEGLSFFIGDFRLSLERVMLIILIPMAVSRFFQRTLRNSVRVPSDALALAAGVWMLVAAVVTGGFAGLKGAGIAVIEFSGAYYVFRYLLPSDGSVRLTRFSCKLVVLVVGVALLDPLTDKLFTYEVVKGFTGYVKPVYEAALAAQGETLFRDGVIRAMGPLEHSILFGAVCAWFGTLAFFTFPTRFFGWSVAGIALIGIWVSQARAPLLGFMIAFALAIFYVAAKGFAARWKVLGLLVTLVIITVFSFSGSPIATLMRLGGIGPEAAWYRQAIWDTAVPVVAHSPVFGIGLTDEWDWQSNAALVGTSVDAFWLRAAMMYGIPGTVLILLTMIGAFWLGPVERSRYLSDEEKRLSVALGLVTTTAVFLGFTVHFWGTCWVLIGIFPAIRANLAEAAIVRQRAASEFEAKRG
jgi:O-antigen ligase